MKDRHQWHLLLISGLVLLLASPIVSCAAGNTPPPTPSSPSGPDSGDSGIPCAYSTSSIDPDNDQVKYVFDWGDGSTSETSFLPSGTTGTSSHVWDSPGTYYVRTKAVDSNGTPSGWSPAVMVIISAITTVDLTTPVSLMGPPNGAVLASTSSYCYNERFVLEWERQWTVCEYEFDISLDQSFAQIVLDETSWPPGTGGFCVPCDPFSPAAVIQQGSLDCGTTYYWRVKSHCTEAGRTVASSWSATWTFTIRASPGS